MNTPFASLAVLFREAGLLTDEQWSAHVGTAGGSKHIKDVLYQDVSLGTLKDLIFAEIPLPFTKTRRTAPLHQALSSQIRLTDREMMAIFKAFQPSVAHVTGPFLQAGLIHNGDMDAALKRPDMREMDPFEQLINQSVLKPEALTQVLGNSALRGSWPYRFDLVLSLLEENRLIEPDKAAALRPGTENAGGNAEALLGALKAPLLESAQQGLNLLETDVLKDEIEEALIRSFPVSVLRRHTFLPLGRDNGMLHVAFADPMNLTLGDMLWLLTGLRIWPYAAPAADILKRIDDLFVESAPVGPAVAMATAASAPVERMADSTSTVQLVSTIIEGAIDLGGTDIHLEPTNEGTMRVRYRIDGMLRNILTIPGEAVQPVVSRIKVLSNLNVTERRRPQDGHFALQAGETQYDFRISTLPCHRGEKVVIRVLDESRVLQGLSDIGVTAQQQQVLERLCRQPYGMILVTGPTGSGKTSTLYACLQTVNSLQVNIVTIEDPVEYQLAGVNQVQVNTDIEMGFAQGLRSILRQDPDVIMVGEIRDAETAGIAIRAAITGHLVFSTLHTNTALGAFNTLSHLGVQPFMSSGAVLAVIAQRLVRRICPDCRVEVDVNPDLAKAVAGRMKPLEKVYLGKGCDSCMGSGFRGRTGLFEIVENTDGLRKLLNKGATEPMLAKQTAKDGSISILEAGREKVMAGETTLEEICFRAMTMAGL